MKIGSGIYGMENEGSGNIRGNLACKFTWLPEEIIILWYHLQ